MSWQCVEIDLSHTSSAKTANLYRTVDDNSLLHSTTHYNHMALTPRNLQYNKYLANGALCSTANITRKVPPEKEWGKGVSSQRFETGVICMM
jgi:hypothetical protein